MIFIVAPTRLEATLYAQRVMDIKPTQWRFIDSAGSADRLRGLSRGCVVVFDTKLSSPVMQQLQIIDRSPDLSIVFR